jgi:hypothetical protein
MGTTKGGHVYLEAPDQSSNPTARMDGVTLLDGSTYLQGDFAPIDLGKVPYLATDQPWTFVVAIPDSINPRVANNLRIYVSSYSDEIDTPLVRAGLGGATPSVVVTLPATVQNKPGSAANVTPFLITGITAVALTPVLVAGKLKRPISVTVDTSGLPTGVPTNWGYHLLGFLNNDITSDAVLATGIITDGTGGLVPAGPDGIDVAHTFGPDEPTVVTSITIYAVAGIVTGDKYMPSRSGGHPPPPGTFVSNNIVPGITASATISIGTTTGVIDPTAHIVALLDGSVGTLTGVFGVLPLGIDNTRLALSSVATANLQNLLNTAAKMAASSITAANAALGSSSVVAANMSANSVTAGNAAIANLAVGTAGIQLAAITQALMATASIGNAQIQALAVQDGNILSLAAGKILAGTIAVAISLTAPTILVGGSGWTINLDSTNGFKITKGTGTVQISGSTGTLFSISDSAGIGISISPSTGAGIFINSHVGSSQQCSINNSTIGISNIGNGHGAAFNEDGFIFVGAGIAFTGTLAAAIAAGKFVQGGIIMA